MFSNKDLIALHVQTLFTQDIHSRLLLINEPGGGRSAPRFFFGKTTEGNLWRFRADLPSLLIQELEALCRDEPAGEHYPSKLRYFDQYARLLETHAPIQEVKIGPAYQFAHLCGLSRNVIAITEPHAELLQSGFDELLEELPEWQPFLVLVEDSQAVSVCRSVRITPQAHEAGVETLPSYRGKGYATKVVTGWAKLVKARGAIPMYSTTWENIASQAVARKLQLVLYGEDFQIT